MSPNQTHSRLVWILHQGLEALLPTTKVAFSYTEDFGLPLKRELEILPVGRLGVLFLGFFVYESNLIARKEIYLVLVSILAYPI